MTPEVDYNHLLDGLYRFYEAFLTPVEDCEVNAFLRLTHPKSRALALLGEDDVKALSVGKHLEGLRERGRWITCKECAKIGDAIIALEQPASWCLVHTDGAFDDLCRCLKRNHTKIRSVTSLKNEQRGS